VATASSLSAVNAQRRFGFRHAATGEDSVLDDPDIDVVFIATRHHSHADLVCRALERQKTVFVEKPLALSAEQLDAVLETVRRTGNDRLMVGFNRRFAPLFTAMKSRFGSVSDRGSGRYLINAGRLDRSSWYMNEAQEGSRFVGEGGHFIDTLSWWFDAQPVSVYAVSGTAPHDVHATVMFDDGSVGTISYVTTGNSRVPKEMFDASAGGRSARLDNFRTARVWTGRRRHNDRSTLRIDKGQSGEIDAFVTAVRQCAPMPIPLDSLAATTRATIATARSLTTGLVEEC
jgi:predicted dehydrogenase